MRAPGYYALLILLTAAHSFFTRIDHVLRRSLGVSEKLEADKNVKPAPPVEAGPLQEDDEEPELLGQPGMGDIGADFVDWKDFKAKRGAEAASEPDAGAHPHDEL